MTATHTEPRATTVTCHRCRRGFAITHDDLRALNDRGGQPHCGCKRQKPTRTLSRGLTKAELILLAVESLEDAHLRPPAVSAIIVWAWHTTPSAFGLAGYEAQHPDSNRVIMDLVKMQANGLVSRPEPRHYAITEKGRKAAAAARTRRQA
jgi:hypothetical protein